MEQNLLMFFLVFLIGCSLFGLANGFVQGFIGAIKKKEKKLWKEEFYNGWKYDASTGIIPKQKWDLHEGDTMLDMEYFISEMIKKND